MANAERQTADENRPPTNGSQMPTWAVIMHESLSDSQLSTLLRQKKMKVRFSSGAVSGSIIFPQSALAFMVVPVSETVSQVPATGQFQIDPKLQDRLDQLIHVHRDCYLLCMAPMHGKTERDIFCYLQSRYLHTQLGFVPVHNLDEAVKCMLTMAKPLCKPYSEILTKRFEDSLAEYQQKDILATILNEIGLDKHECNLIADGLGSLRNVSTATREELLDCSLDGKAADNILAVFRDKPDGDPNLMGVGEAVGMDTDLPGDHTENVGAPENVDMDINNMMDERIAGM